MPREKHAFFVFVPFQTPFLGSVEKYWGVFLVS